MAALGVLIGFGFLANVGLAVLFLSHYRQELRRERRQRAVARELNARRWAFTEQLRALGGNSRVLSDERWPS